MSLAFFSHTEMMVFCFLLIWFFCICKLPLLYTVQQPKNFEETVHIFFEIVELTVQCNKDKARRNEDRCDNTGLCYVAGHNNNTTPNICFCIFFINMYTVVLHFLHKNITFTRLSVCFRHNNEYTTLGCIKWVDPPPLCLVQTTVWGTAGQGQCL